MKLALDIKESSEAIGVGTTNLRKMCRDNIIPSYKEGKKIMIPVKALEQWVEKQVETAWRKTSWGNLNNTEQEALML